MLASSQLLSGPDSAFRAGNMIMIDVYIMSSFLPVDTSYLFLLLINNTKIKLLGGLCFQDNLNLFLI